MGRALEGEGTTPSGRSGVRLESLTKYYGGTLAVRDLTLEVRAGEFLTLLGPSGSGKTTTLMMVAGFEGPTAGEIFVDGRRVTDDPPYRRNIGMVFQNYALFPHLTVFQNIAFPLEMRRMPRVDVARRVGEALELVRLPDMGSRYPRQLSGGQQQRVALARAIAFHPPLLLMDEPLGALDKKLREHMEIEIKSIQQRLGITVLYVTHDQEEALVMSDRIAVMRDGQLEQVDVPERLYESPANLFVADFIGETNLLEGAFTVWDERRGLVTTRGGLKVWVAGGGPGAPAQKVTLVVRPEKISVGPEVVACANTYEGAVEQVIYVGETTRVRVRLTPEEGVVVKVQNRGDPAGFRIGDRIVVGWEPADARAVVA